MRMRGWLLLIAGLACLSIPVVLRLRERAEFRARVRPLLEEDLSDFASVPSGALMASESISRRKKRIAELELFDAGHYRDARDRFVGLMQSENQSIAVGEQVRELTAKIPFDLQAVRLSEASMDVAAQATGAPTCDALEDALNTLAGAGSDLELVATLPQAAENVRQQAVSAWNGAYGWIRWLGLDFEPHNPFDSPPETALQPAFLRVDAVAKTVERARSSVERRCGSQGTTLAR